jgi:hypothetical protein
VSLVRPKLEYTSCVWLPFYDVHVNRIERVQRKFIMYAVRRLGWMGMHTWIDVSCFVCRLCVVGKLTRAWYLFSILSGRVNSPDFMTQINVNTPRYPTRRGDFLRVDFHRTITMGFTSPWMVRFDNEVACLTFIYLEINSWIDWDRYCSLLPLCIHY